MSQLRAVLRRACLRLGPSPRSPEVSSSSVGEVLPWGVERALLEGAGSAGGGLAEGRDFTEALGSPPGRSVWEGTEGQGLSTSGAIPVNAFGCRTWAIYARHPLWAQSLGRRVQPHTPSAHTSVPWFEALVQGTAVAGGTDGARGT